MTKAHAVFLGTSPCTSTKSKHISFKFDNCATKILVLLTGRAVHARKFRAKSVKAYGLKGDRKRGAVNQQSVAISEPGSTTYGDITGDLNNF